MSRIGVLGGTFNPIHFGHLRCAEEAREQLDLERVIFVPSATPPHKTHDVAAAKDRLEMVRLATLDNPKFSVSRVEAARGGPSYLVDTLRLLGGRYPGERIVFLLGSDALREIDSWKDWRELLTLADFGVFVRPPTVTNHLRGIFPVAARKLFCYQSDSVATHESGTQVTLLQQTPLDISSTTIRRACAADESIRYLVPSSVERYIRRHGLYS